MCIQLKVDTAYDVLVIEVLYRTIGQTLMMKSLHSMLNFKIGGLDCGVISTEQTYCVID